MKMTLCNAEPGVLWSVRGTAHDADVAMVVEAPTKTEAEAAGWGRGVQVVIVTEATAEEVTAAKEAKMFHGFTPAARLQCFGRPVRYGQAACLVLCACATIVLDLRAWHVPLHF